MSTSAHTAPGRADASRPDGPYALVAGLYVSAHLVPLVLLVVSGVVTDAGALYVSFLLAVTGVTALSGWVVSRLPGLAVRVGRHDAAWLLVAVPFVWFLGAYGGFGLVGLDPPALVALLSVLGIGGGMLCGILLVPMSRTRHANAATDGATELVAWEARWPRGWRRTGRVVSLGAFAVGAVGVVGAFGLGYDWAWNLYYFVFVGAVAMNVLNPRTFRVTDAGLVVEYPLVRRFRPWSAYIRYDVTTDALVIRPTGRWRPAHRCARDDIEELDAVVAALDEVLV
jgi:hypothetical protein